MKFKPDPETTESVTELTNAVNRRFGLCWGCNLLFAHPDDCPTSFYGLDRYLMPRLNVGPS